MTALQSTIVTAAIVLATFGTKGPSGNRKIGPVYATYRALGTDWTCPSDCLMVKDDDSVCYAGQHHVGRHQLRARQNIADLDAWIRALPSRRDGKARGVRHLVSGDLFLRNQPDYTYIDAMNSGHIARPNTYGWAYTHGWRRLEARRVNVAPNLTVNASCETEADITAAHAAGWAAVTIVAPDSPAGYIRYPGYTVLTCPAQTGHAVCDTCRLCAYGPMHPKRIDRATGNPVVIGFRVHGAVNRVAAAINASWRQTKRRLVG